MGTTDPGVGTIAILAEDGSFNESVETIVDQYNNTFSTDTNLLNIRVKDGLGNWGKLYKRTLVFHSTMIPFKLLIPLTIPFAWVTPLL